MKAFVKENKKLIIFLSAIIVSLSVFGGLRFFYLASVSAQILPIIVHEENLDFGTVFPGEEREGSFEVHYVKEYTEGDITYRIIQKRKPLSSEHPEYPDGGDPEMPGFYRNLCPFLEKVSVEQEGDTEKRASVGPADLSDVWIIYFKVPAIVGNVSQDHIGGVVTSNGEYGCDISIDVLEEGITSICGTKFFDQDRNGEMDGNDYGLFGWTIQLKKPSACSQGEEWADTVVSYSQGKRKDGTAVLPERSNPAAALGQAEYDTLAGHFYSLGFGNKSTTGVIVLGFDNYIINGPGPDIELVEATNEPYPAETVDVYVSKDNTEWIYLGNYNKDASLDLSSYSPSLTWFKYIKLIDTTNPALHNSSADGYDLDGVKAINCASGWELIKTKITGEKGEYCFEPLAAGVYRVGEILKSGWINTTDLFKDLKIGEGEQIIVDFGNYQ